MSLSTNVSSLATRIATELKAHKVLINGNAADLSALTTTAKTDLVSAINEVVASISSSGGAAIDDTGTSSSSVWSSSKTDSSISSAVSAAVSGLVAAAPSTLDTLKELADALGDDANFASTMTTALASKAVIGTVSGTAADAALVGDTTTNFVTVFESGLS